MRLPVEPPAGWAVIFHRAGTSDALCPFFQEMIPSCNEKPAPFVRWVPALGRGINRYGAAALGVRFFFALAMAKNKTAKLAQMGVKCQSFPEMRWINGF